MYMLYSSHLIICTYVMYKAVHGIYNIHVHVHLLKHVLLYHIPRYHDVHMIR